MEAVRPIIDVDNETKEYLLENQKDLPIKRIIRYKPMRYNQFRNSTRRGSFRNSIRRSAAIAAGGYRTHKKRQLNKK